jgi:SAM-dependent methyltransferase
LSTIKLPFSAKYDRKHSEHYLQKHRQSGWRGVSHWREEHLARRALALAGEPGLVLDLPSGAGRFWPLLAEKPGRMIIGADNSPDMLRTACQAQPEQVVRRVRTLCTSAFAIDLPDNSVDSIFCMRLLHHVGDPAHRQVMLREFHRVSRDSLIVSLWVDGNFKAWKRRRLEAWRLARNADERHYQNRHVVAAVAIEAEFEAVGFQVQEHLDMLPMYAMWRTYVLRK